jgi:hypothetical protein
MSLIHWWNSRRNAKLEHKLTAPQKVDLSKPADITYPPPSAYEVIQLNNELEPYHAIGRVYKGIQNGN